MAALDSTLISESDDPWKQLTSGDHFEVQSRSRAGQIYSLIFLAVGSKAVGLYVRLDSNKLGRLDPARVEWSTLRVVNSSPPMVAGDEVLVVSQGTKYRGNLEAPITDSIPLKLSDGKSISLPLMHCDASSLKILFPASRIFPGDEFLVESKSGNEYHARAQAVDGDRVRVKLVDKSKEDPVNMHLSHLALPTLRVLVPVPVSLLDCSPIA